MKTVDEILAHDTSALSLAEMIEMLDDVSDQNAIFRLRKRHEIDSGIPMEEDEFGEGEASLFSDALASINEKLED